MTYVASPSYSKNAEARASNLKQCLETARRHLNETSRASDSEKLEDLVASAVEAGWEEDEVRNELEQAQEHSGQVLDVQQTATFGVVPSSSL